jgi:nitroreductase
MVNSNQEADMIRELIIKNRSYRRFYQDREIEIGTLRELIDLARLSPSASNLQPLKYIISCNSERNEQIFPLLSWAGYLKNWPGPAEGERPSAYIIILKDTTISKSIDCDHGIACQSILLGASEKGLGGCIIGSIQRKQLKALLNIPEHLEILLVLALGVAKETIVLDTVGSDNKIEYWRDEKSIHHVPKRSLDEIIIG